MDGYYTRGISAELDAGLKFVFDLDGTITQRETLPIIARHFGVHGEIGPLTERTIAGDIPFVESFVRRVEILGDFSVGEIDALLGQVELFDGMMRFIDEHAGDCAIATGNLDVWTRTLLRRFPCVFYASSGTVIDDKIVTLDTVLDKAVVVEALQHAGHKVVYIGDGHNDAGAMRRAEFSIACGLVHTPAKSVLAAADRVIFCENDMVELLASLAAGNTKIG